jgi:uncharacterized membrane protein
MMNAIVWLVAGIGVGWGLSRLFDPDRGRRRRALLRDKAISVAHTIGDAVDTTSRDVRNRTRGAIAELRKPSAAPADDDNRRGQRFELLQSRWSPTARLLMGLGGGALTVFGVSSGGLVGTVIVAGGLTVLARAVTNLELGRLFGIGARRWPVTVQKTITVAAPVEEVFDFWCRYENFPRFMAHVRDVERLGPGRARWTVAGPGGLPIQWETEETRCERPRLLAWATTAGSPVSHAGVVRFDPEAAGTRVHVQLHYNPPAGALGHAVATLLGADPKRAFDDDLVRLKSLLEEGKTSVGGQPVRRDALGGER